jgi:pentatricopeptide repeat protein
VLNNSLYTAISKRLEHFYIYKEQGRLSDMNYELYKEFLYYCVMQAIEDKQAVEKAFEIAQAAVDAGHKLEVEAYTFLIQVSALNRRTELVEKLWKEMDTNQIPKDNQHIYGAMLRAYALFDDEAKAKGIYQEMLSKDLMPKFITFERVYRNLKYF